MDALVQAILASRQARMRTTADTKAHTASMLSAFGREREAAAAAMKALLSGNRRARTAECRARAVEVRRMLRELHRDRERMGRALHQQLSRAAKGIASTVAAHLDECAKARHRAAKAHRRSMAEQRAELAADRRRRIQTVGSLIEDFNLDRGEQAQDQAENLEAFAGGIRSSVAGLIEQARTFREESGRNIKQQLGQALSAIRDRAHAVAAETRDFLTGYRRVHEEMAERLGCHLASGVRDRRQEVGRLVAGCVSARGTRRADLHAAHHVWSRTRAAGGAAAVAAPEAERRKLETEEERKARERSEAEAARRRKAEEERRAKETWAKMSDEEKILHVIRKHPDGLTASQIGEMVNLHPAVAGRIATELVERGEAGKNESARLYYPV